MHKPTPKPGSAPRHGVARVMSKLGITSRTQATRWVIAGRVKVNGMLVLDAEFPVRQGVDRISVDGHDALPAARVVIMLNKPRGLLTTTHDDQARDTVYSCLQGSGLPWVAPVGRLDKASEGLLLFSNDPVWAAGVTDPVSALDKAYHVQINRLPDAALLAALERGIDVEGEHLSAKAVRCLRMGDKNAWLEIVLDEGRNRQIRRLLSGLSVAVIRLVRISIGTLTLGELPKGQWRMLTEEETAAFVPRTLSPGNCRTPMQQ